LKSFSSAYIGLPTEHIEDLCEAFLVAVGLPDGTHVLINEDSDGTDGWATGTAAAVGAAVGATGQAQQHRKGHKVPKLRDPASQWLRRCVGRVKRLTFASPVPAWERAVLNFTQTSQLDSTPLGDTTTPDGIHAAIVGYDVLFLATDNVGVWSWQRSQTDSHASVANILESLPKAQVDMDVCVTFDNGKTFVRSPFILETPSQSPHALYHLSNFPIVTEIPGAGSNDMARGSTAADPQSGAPSIGSATARRFCLPDDLPESVQDKAGASVFAVRSISRMDHGYFLSLSNGQVCFSSVQSAMAPTTSHGGARLQSVEFPINVATAPASAQNAVVTLATSDLHGAAIVEVDSGPSNSKVSSSDDGDDDYIGVQHATSRRRVLFCFGSNSHGQLGRQFNVSGDKLSTRLQSILGIRGSADGGVVVHEPGRASDQILGDVYHVDCGPRYTVCVTELPEDKTSCIYSFGRSSTATPHTIGQGAKLKPVLQIRSASKFGVMASTSDGSASAGDGTGGSGALAGVPYLSSAQVDEWHVLQSARRELVEDVMSAAEGAGAHDDIDIASLIFECDAGFRIESSNSASGDLGVLDDRIHQTLCAALHSQTRTKLGVLSVAQQNMKSKQHSKSKEPESNCKNTSPNVDELSEFNSDDWFEAAETAHPADEEVHELKKELRISLEAAARRRQKLEDRIQSRQQMLESIQELLSPSEDTASLLRRERRLRQECRDLVGVATFDASPS